MTRISLAAGVCFATAWFACATPVDKGFSGSSGGSAGADSARSSTGSTTSDGGNGGEAKACAASLTACEGSCVNLTSDASHCGGCGSPCPGNQLCSSSQCMPACEPQLTVCGQMCVDTQANNQHCGGCDQACAEGRLCVAGACQCGTGTECAGECVDTSSDLDHCGGCDRACPADQRCDGGECTCPNSLPDDCSGTCVDTTSDHLHCGSCETECADGKLCQAGGCVAPLKVRTYMDGGWWNFFHIAICNTMNQSIDFSATPATIKYWFTADNGKDPTGLGGWDGSSLGLTSTFSIEKLSIPRRQATHAVVAEVTGGVLEAGTCSGQANRGVADGANGVFTNDWSFNDNTSELQDNPRAAAYVRGQLAWGSEPPAL